MKTHIIQTEPPSYVVTFQTKHTKTIWNQTPYVTDYKECYEQYLKLKEDSSVTQLALIEITRKILERHCR